MLKRAQMCKHLCRWEIRHWGSAMTSHHCLGTGVTIHVYRHDYACIQTWLYTFVVVISMPWHRQAIFESKEDKLSFSAECRIRTQMVSGTESPADWMPADKPTELSRIKLKSWTRQPVPMVSEHRQSVPMISEHSAHSTPLPMGIRSLLWRYTCFLFLIPMLWHGQAIFEPKGDKLCIQAWLYMHTGVIIHAYRRDYACI